MLSADVPEELLRRHIEAEVDAEDLLGEVGLADLLHEARFEVTLVEDVADETLVVTGVDDLVGGDLLTGGGHHGPRAARAVINIDVIDHRLVADLSTVLLE